MDIKSFDEFLKYFDTKQIEKTDVVFGYIDNSNPEIVGLYEIFKNALNNHAKNQLDLLREYHEWLTKQL